MGKEEFEALFRKKDTDPQDLNTEYWYGTPAIYCECGAAICLPYGSLPGMDSRGTTLKGNDPLELPPDEWSQVFGCIRCGHIATYAGIQVCTLLVRKPSKSIFHKYADVWRVTFPCGDKGCAALLSVHVDMREYHATPNTADASDAVAALRTADVAGQRLSCGHDLKTIPAKFYQAERVTSRMW
jgi:hypothetical protein